MADETVAKTAIGEIAGVGFDYYIRGSKYYIKKGKKLGTNDFHQGLKYFELLIIEAHKFIISD